MVLFGDKLRHSSTYALVIVCLANFIDVILDGLIVPIAPDLILLIDYPDINDTTKITITTLQQYTSTCPTITVTNSSDTNLSVAIEADNFSSCVLTEESFEQINRWAIIEKDLIQKSAWIIAAKTMSEFVFDPLCGLFVYRINSSIPLFIGFLVMFLASAAFPLGTAYWVLILCRIGQGIGSGVATIAGLALMFETYLEETERNIAIGKVYTMSGIGATVGPVAGAVMFQFVAPWSPFILPAILSLIAAVMQFFVTNTRLSNKPLNLQECAEILVDPYIWVAIGIYFFGWIDRARIQTIVPTRILSHTSGLLGEDTWKQGLVFLPLTLSFIAGINIMSIFAKRIGRHIVGILSMLVMGIGIVLEELTVNYFVLLCLVQIISGLAMGFGQIASVPTVAYLVDLRHQAGYGQIYTIVDMVHCLALTIGPILIGFIVANLSYEYANYIIAIVFVAYSPVAYFLKNPPPRNRALTQEETVRLKDNLSDNTYNAESSQ